MNAPAPRPLPAIETVETKAETLLGHDCHDLAGRLTWAASYGYELPVEIALRARELARERGEDSKAASLSRYIRGAYAARHKF